MSREEMDAIAKERLVGIAREWYDQMQNGIVPYVRLPTRTKQNIEYDDESEVWKYGERESTRAATTEKSAIHLLKMAYVIGFLKQQLEENRSSTLRELYYISEGWKKAKFSAQDESNLLIEDLEIITDVQREAFHLRPEEDGASIFGPLRIRETTRRGVKEIHCQEDVGEAGYPIPNNVDTLDFVDHDAKFVIAIETGGMYARLMENGFDEEYGAILVHLKGQPARSTRRVLRRLNESLDLPVVVFTDGDPWSYRIYASVAYGSIKSAHMSELLATPRAQFVGVQPTDISDYNLPSDKLTEQDINALKAELTDPRFATEYWHNQINLQLEMKLKSEQQAFASRGLDFVTKEYLPTRLSEMGVI
ncbi:MAG TPA: DNA topoisomerase IV subunit A [Candidatus Methanoculleus thermohydrogenotrophicum]|jgi:DNA topoisomerase-6 subunit A|nr:DNA topoisomerase IV subunit A [Candidatus Methanoculleus thermohydrogenotrophicum]NLM83025.1 DNA topoisomerase IV subunit A [Candidatus Methanoculleus thermohydrogenotrophicum]HOB17596.1 DNA topoisomerase IV subunit A [Candidatus Methanoculleus thermohydrogenotrophicum]HPZ38273.1 DNA topoisomerase IV subunit A [Candidatus Methanoculleus thermohydrogenotrophicum]